MAAHPRSRLFRLASTTAVLLILGSVLPALAQRPPDERRQPRDAFRGRTDVIEVQIPVNVSTRSGEPVRGLTAADFAVYEGRKRLEIADFEVIDLDLVEPGYSRTEVDSAIAAAARRHILLVFDISFSRPTTTLRAREAARSFVLNDLHPTDLVAVATHSIEGGARLVVTFTPDRAQVARAIDTLGAPRLLGLQRRDPLMFMIEDPHTVLSPASQDALMDTQSGVRSLRDESVLAHMRVIGKEMMKGEKAHDRGRISSWTRSMGELGRMLDSVQGRKHLVYFSEGFDGRLLLGRNPNAEDRTMQEDIQNLNTGNYSLVDTDDMYGNTGLQSSMALMIQEFKHSDVAIQAVDISGLTAETSAVAAIGNASDDALFYIANETGGRLFENANDFGPELREAMARTSVTYLLTVRPENVRWDGAYHRVKVKANLPRGARLSARDGYYAPRPYDELHPLERNLLAADAIASAAPEEDLALSVLAAPFRASEGQWYVPVIIEIDGEPLLLDHQGDRMPVEFYTYVTDRKGEMKDFFTQLVTLDLTRRREAFASTGLKYYGSLNLQPGEYLVRVLVRNSQTGRSGVQTARVEVPVETSSDAFLLPPFFLEQGPSWFLVREKRNDVEGRSVVYPFTVNGEPYIPAARPALASGDEAALCLVAYNLGDGDLSVDSTIVAEDGRVLDGGSLSLVERTVTGIEGLDKVLATFRPEGLEAGRYTLQVELTHERTGLTERNSIPFNVRNRR